MPSRPDAMPTPAEISLEAGLVALKQGNYETAIAKLIPVANDGSNPTASLQARVGLVMSYTRTRKIAKAIALCQTLTESDNTQVKDWAISALEQLQKHRNSKDTDNVRSKDREFTDADAASRRTATLPANYRPRIIEESTSSGKLFTSTIPTSVEQPSIYWRQAKRAKVWQPLRKGNLFPLHLLGIATFLALFLGWTEVMRLLMGMINYALVKLPYVEPWPWLNANPIWLILVFLLLNLVLCPWLLDWVLTNFYGQRHLSKELLHGYSRESTRIIQRYCQQRRWKSPSLRVLPFNAPLVLTYGNHSSNARILVSQGLLEQLADDEIATIYAAQMGHIAHGDCVITSLVLLISLPLYLVYHKISEWGSKRTIWIFRQIVNILTSIIYGLWCLPISVSLWLSRVRFYYSDRLSAEITGNPNALTRSLLKIAVGICEEIRKSGQTHWYLESLNLLLPISHQQSLTVGSIAGNLPFESILMWDIMNPYARWFTINNSHPLIGDRIQHLSQIARHWHIDPELHLNHLQPVEVKRQSFLLQIAPFLGISLGLVLAAIIWIMWQFAFEIKFLNLRWVYSNWYFVIGYLLIGFSTGMILRINLFFPEIKTPSVQNVETLPSLLSDPSPIPIDNISVRLVGRLLGRDSMRNSLGQDLVLECQTGLIKLHHVCLGQLVNPQDFIGRQVMVTGWFRRGATPWIDIQTVELQNGTVIHSPHGIWSTVVAVTAQALGAYIFLMG